MMTAPCNLRRKGKTKTYQGILVQRNVKLLKYQKREIRNKNTDLMHTMRDMGI